MNAFEEEMCFTVALYGIALDEAGMVPLLGDVIEFLRAAGQPPSHLWVTGRGFGKQPLLFEPTWKRVQKAPVGHMRSLTARAFVEGWENQLCDWTATGDIYLEDGYFQLGASLPAMPDAQQQIIGFVRRSMARIRPAYGIGFFRKRGRGPSCFGIGLAYGGHHYSGPEYEEDLAICRWGDGMADAVYNDGILRDAHPYHLLTDRHLEQDIDGRSLRAWIQAEAWRGQLAAWEDGFTLWTVSREHVGDVRRQLAPSGVLFVRRPENWPEGRIAR